MPHSLRNVAAISMLVLVWLAGAGGASAAPGDAIGGLIQLAPPHACVNQQPLTPCGSSGDGALVSGASVRRTASPSRPTARTST